VLAEALSLFFDGRPTACCSKGATSALAAAALVLAEAPSLFFGGRPTDRCSEGTTRSAPAAAVLVLAEAPSLFIGGRPLPGPAARWFEGTALGAAAAAAAAAAVRDLAGLTTGLCVALGVARELSLCGGAAS